jgi:hypothetical protein
MVPVSASLRLRRHRRRRLSRDSAAPDSLPATARYRSRNERGGASGGRSALGRQRHWSPAISRTAASIPAPSSSTGSM